MNADNQHETAQVPLFLYIPVARLVLLSIVSFGLYEAYWIYKNWSYIKERDGLNIMPFWRGVFGLFFCHSLLRRIYEDKEARVVQPPSFSAGGLATGWVVLMIVSNVVGRARVLLSASFQHSSLPSFVLFQSRIMSTLWLRNEIQSHPITVGHLVILYVWSLESLSGHSS